MSKFTAMQINKSVKGGAINGGTLEIQEEFQEEIQE